MGFILVLQTQLNNEVINLQRLMVTTQQTIVIINADKIVEHGNVVAVVDQVKKIDEVKVAIATKKPELSYAK